MLMSSPILQNKDRSKNKNFIFFNDKKAILKELRLSFYFAIPFISIEFLSIVQGFISTIFVSKLSHAELAANALGSGVFIAILVFSLGVYSAISIMGSQSYGKKDDKAVGIIFRQGILLSILFAFVMMLIMYLSTKLFFITGQSPIVIHYAKPFFLSLMWCLIPFSLFCVCTQLLVAVGKAKIVTLFTLIQTVIIVFLTYSFMFGKFYMPALRLPAVGYSYIFGDLLSFAGIFIYIISNKEFKKYNLLHELFSIKKLFGFSGKFIFEMLRVGLPLSFIYCIEVALFAAIPFMMGRLGQSNLAAYQIGYQFLMLGLGVLFGLTQSTSVRVGVEVGKNRKEDVVRTTYINIFIGFSFSLLFFILYSCFSSFVIGIDLNTTIADNYEIISIAKKFLFVVGVMLIGDSLRLITLGALRGMKDTKFPVVASLVGFWCIGFSLAYIFAFIFNLGAVSIWWALIIGFLSAGLILTGRFLFLIKRIDFSTLVTRS